MGWSRVGTAPAFRGRANHAVSTQVAWTPQPNQPDRVQIRIKHFVPLTLTSTAGAFVTHNVKMNSLKVPFTDFGSSSQSANLSNLAASYSRYRVTYATLTVALSPVALATTPCPMFVAGTILDPTVNIISITAFNQLLQSKMGRFINCPATYGFTGKPVVLKLKGAPAVVAGLSNMEYQSDSRFEGNVNTSVTVGDPGNIMQFHIAWQANDATSTTAVAVDFVLEQWVTFYGRAQYL